MAKVTKKQKSTTTPKTQQETPTQTATPATKQNQGFFTNAANFLLSRLPWFQDRYETWSRAKKIIIAFLLYLIILPVIPIAIGIIMYINDPEGFKKSPALKVLVVIAIAQLSAFGLIAVQPPKESDVSDAIQTNQQEVKSTTNTKKATTKDKDGSDTTPIAQSSESRKKVQAQTASNSTNGNYFENCDAAFEKGVFNIKRSDKSYRPALDRDDDGVACEK